MALEIERKFLVQDDSYKAAAFKSVRMIQGYISSSPGRTVRVRIADGQGSLTIKGASSASGAARYEWEKEIPEDEARALLEIAEPGVIDKTRYLIANSDGVHTWEVDEFYGENAGLVVAEIELGFEEEPFDRPAWLGPEVTGDPRYYNSHLTKNPYRNW